MQSLGNLPATAKLECRKYSTHGGSSQLSFDENHHLICAYVKLTVFNGSVIIIEFLNRSDKMGDNISLVSMTKLQALTNLQVHLANNRFPADP